MKNVTEVCKKQDGLLHSYRVKQLSDFELN